MSALAIVALLALSGCVTAEKPACVQLQNENCVGSKVRQICEDRDGCRVCYCTPSPATSPAPAVQTRKK